MMSAAVFCWYTNPVFPPKPGGCTMGSLLYPKLSNTVVKLFNPLSLLTEEICVRKLVLNPSTLISTLSST